MHPNERAQRREAEWLRLHAIIDERERKGDFRLPPESKLCEQVGVTRARLRGLLKRAEDQGLIWRHVGKGTFAGARPIVREDAVEKLAVSVDDLFDARMLIEPMLAAQAALHATMRDIAAMTAIQDDMLTAPSFQEWRRLDARLHRQVALATHNSLLVLLYDTLRMPMRLGLDMRIEEVFSAPVKPRTATNLEHGELVEAIAAHRPDRAEEIMHDHVRSVRDQLFGPR